MRWPFLYVSFPAVPSRRTDGARLAGLRQQRRVVPGKGVSLAFDRALSDKKFLFLGCVKCQFGLWRIWWKGPGGWVRRRFPFIISSSGLESQVGWACGFLPACDAAWAETWKTQCWVPVPITRWMWSGSQTKSAPPGSPGGVSDQDELNTNCFFVLLALVVGER